MSAQPEISQRDLRLRSKEIMDSVERGQAFTVTRDGHQIGELIPLRRRTFVPRSEFLTSGGTTAVDPQQFRSDLDAVIDDDIPDAAARGYGQLTGAVRALGRTPRRHHADLQIAAIAAADGLAPGRRR